MDLCHEMSQCAPMVTDVTAKVAHQIYQGILVSVWLAMLHYQILRFEQLLRIQRAGWRVFVLEDRERAVLISQILPDALVHNGEFRF